MPTYVGADGDKRDGEHSQLNDGTAQCLPFDSNITYMVSMCLCKPWCPDNDIMGIVPSGQARIHPTLGPYYLSLSPKGTQRMVVHAIVDSQGEYLRWRERKKTIHSAQVSQFLFLSQEEQFQDAACCGMGGVSSAKLAFEGVYGMTLQSELRLRRPKSNQFLQTQLWYILLALVQVGSHFERSGWKVGDIHPRNILISEEGQVKIVSSCSLPRQLTNFDKALQSESAEVFLAPEQLDSDAMEKGEYPKGVDPTRAECFSIGLCMLAAGTLQGTEEFYSRQGGTSVNWATINACLDKFGLKYGSFLGWIIKGLINADPTQRMSCSSIYAMLQTNKQRIINLQSFTTIGKQPKMGGSMPLPPNGPGLQNGLVRGEIDVRPIHSKANSTNIYYHPKGTQNPLTKDAPPSSQAYLRKHFISSFQV